MKPNNEQLAILSDMEMWAKKIKKESEGWRNKVDTAFKKEVREVCSASYDIRFSLRYDVYLALDELLNYIGSAKDDLEL